MLGLPVTAVNVGATVVDLKQAPCSIIGGTVTNTNQLDGYLVLFDKPAAQVVLGTTVPDFFVSVFGASTSPLCRAGEGIMFRTAVSMACVDTIMGTTARVSNIAAVIE